MFDTIILGGGPAGLAAAIYLARHKLNFALLTGTVGGQALWSDDVENYLGFHLLNGSQLVAEFRKHIDDYQQAFTLKEGEMVRKVERTAQGFSIMTDKADYATKTLLIATGTTHRKLNVPGEKEFYGKGVTYCAACDAPLFKDKTVYVIGGGNSAMDAALFVAKYSSRVKLVVVNKEISGDPIMMEKVKEHPNIQLLTETKTTKILGKDLVVGIGLMGPDGVERTESTDGVFIEIGLVPVTDFIDFVGKDAKGQIVVDKKNATNVEGVWAAGDVTDITEKQISVAVGEGSKAALEMINYFQTH
ncbi:FAD-binding protein [Candidatus Uhrbacteria bacterium]|nr:FAD-binding protein [Candidatus Uhrbacteria bacterium]